MLENDDHGGVKRAALCLQNKLDISESRDNDDLSVERWVVFYALNRELKHKREDFDHGSVLIIDQEQLLAE